MLPPPAAAGGGGGARKGFGAGTTPPTAPRERKPKPKMKKLKPPAGPVPPGPPPPLPRLEAETAPPVDVVAAAAAEADFNRKLEALAKASERAAKARDAETATPGVLEGVPDYSKPAPTLGAALRGETDGSTEAATNSPSFTQGVGAAATAVVLAAVFLFTSGGGGGGGGSARPRPAARPLSESERVEVTAQLESYKATLTSTPTDLTALRGAAAAATALGEPASTAVDYLQRAAEAAPTDASVWVDLASARLDAGDAKGAETAYERARAESPDPAAPPLALAAALARARVESGEAAAAVKEVASLRAAAATSDADRAYDLGLLQGKLLAEWPRHAPEADALYEELAEQKPDDFRAWLARGALARGTGRAGDAARYFLQARYLAKAEERGAVDAVAGG